MSLSSGSSGRYSVQTVTSDHGVVSSLVLSETLAQDFQLRYNCTAWNHFGTETALVTLKEQGTHEVQSSARLFSDMDEPILLIRYLYKTVTYK